VEKASVRYLEALWNSNCDSTLHQVQLANAHSYTSVRKKFGLVANGRGSDLLESPSVCHWVQWPMAECRWL